MDNGKDNEFGMGETSNMDRDKDNDKNYDKDNEFGDGETSNMDRDKDNDKNYDEDKGKMEIGKERGPRAVTTAKLRRVMRPPPSHN